MPANSRWDLIRRLRVNGGPLKIASLEAMPYVGDVSQILSIFSTFFRLGTNSVQQALTQIHQAILICTKIGDRSTTLSVDMGEGTVLTVK